MDFDEMNENEQAEYLKEIEADRQYEEQRDAKEWAKGKSHETAISRN